MLTGGIVVVTVIHAVQIDGTMGQVSKWMLCGAALLVMGVVTKQLRFKWRR